MKRHMPDSFDAPPLALCALPLPCVKRILAFACDVPSPEERRGRTFNLVQHESDLPLPPQLQRFALVSSQWRTLVDDILHERRAFVLRIVLRVNGDGPAVNATAVADELRMRSHPVRELQIAMEAADDDSTSRSSEPLLSHQARIEAADVDWDALLRPCSALWRLDLARLPLHSKHVQQILDAASAHCHELQSLALPNAESGRAVSASSQLDGTFASLFRALECWHARNGGLRQLTVPRRCEEPADAFPEHTDAYLSAVAAFCPNLELLDGWQVTYEESEYIECEEMLFCNVAAWQRFCARCTKLREVNWFIVPFAREFFETFAAHPKAQLTKLTLAGDPPDKWSDDLVDGSYSDIGSFSFANADVARVLVACPALRELSIRIYNSINELVTQELFDDAFLQTLAHACPQLETFSFDELESGQPVSESRVITDAGLTALAQLPDLADVYLKQTSCTGAGVFAFVAEMRRPQRLRRVHLVVGNADQNDYARFYQLLCELLALFGGSSADRFAAHRFEVRIVRQCAMRDSVAQGGRDIVMQFAALVRSLRVTFGSLFQLSIGTDGWDAKIEERSTEELGATLGIAREFVLSSLQQ